jgi:hypothetical protein
MLTRRKKQKIKYSIKKKLNKYKRAVLGNIRARGGHMGDHYSLTTSYRSYHNPSHSPPPRSPTEILVDDLNIKRKNIEATVKKDLRTMYLSNIRSYDNYNELIRIQLKNEAEMKILKDEKNILQDEKNILQDEKNILESQKRDLNQQSRFKMLSLVYPSENQTAIKKKIKEISQKQGEISQKQGEIEQKIEQKDSDIRTKTMEFNTLKFGVEAIFDFLKILLNDRLNGLIKFFNENYQSLNTVFLSYFSVESMISVESMRLLDELVLLVKILYKVFSRIRGLINISNNDKPKEIDVTDYASKFRENYTFDNFMDYKIEIEKYVDIFQHTVTILPDYIYHINERIEYQPQIYQEPFWSRIQRTRNEFFKPRRPTAATQPPKSLVDEDTSFFAMQGGPHGGSKIHHKRNPKTRRRKSRSCKKIYTKKTKRAGKKKRKN